MNITSIYIPGKMFMIQPSKTMGDSRAGRWKAYDFKNIMFAHGEWGTRKWSRYTTGPYFKYPPHFQKAWRHYLHWFTHGKTPVDNIYHLEDVPMTNTMVRMFYCFSEKVVKIQIMFSKVHANMIVLAMLLCSIRWCELRITYTQIKILILLQLSWNKAN